MTKYTNAQLEEEVAKSISFRELARRLGASLAGGTTNNLKRRCIDLGIDFSHFTGRRGAWNKGIASNRKIPWQERLVLRPNGNRIHTPILKQAMLDSGIEYKCAGCGSGPVWRGKVLVLEINHRNGVIWDDRRENLEFDCPNCHSQTPNYKNNKR